MDLAFNVIPLGVDFSQLTENEKHLLFECLSRLLPLGWSTGELQSWYVNRKLSVVRGETQTSYYGRISPTHWRLLLETTPGKEPSWKIGTFQWLPIELAVALLKGQK
jgi:hypothetical protein